MCGRRLALIRIMADYVALRHGEFVDNHKWFVLVCWILRRSTDRSLCQLPALIVHRRTSIQHM